MRWVVDECVSARLVAMLREAGHDVSYAAEMAAGISDISLIEFACRENRLLLTDDKDFGELVIRRQWVTPGVVLMRIAAEQPQTRWKRLQAAILRFGDGLYGKYIVIEPSRFRFRGMPGIQNEE